MLLFLRLLSLFRALLVQSSSRSKRNSIFLLVQTQHETVSEFIFGSGNQIGPRTFVLLHLPLVAVFGKHRSSAVHKQNFEPRKRPGTVFAETVQNSNLLIRTSSLHLKKKNKHLNLNLNHSKFDKWKKNDMTDDNSSINAPYCFRKIGKQKCQSKKVRVHVQPSFGFGLDFAFWNGAATSTSKSGHYAPRSYKLLAWQQEVHLV